MIGADEIRGIRRRLREAEEGTTQEKVSARAAYAQDVKALLCCLEESGVALAIGRIDELEQELAKRDLEAEVEARKNSTFQIPKMPRRQVRIQFAAFDGKLAAAGKDD